MLNNIFVSDALAQATDAAAATNQFSFTSLVPLLAIFVIFYFLIIRPQSKKYKEHQKMVSELKAGDPVITTSGIVGVVKRVLEKDNQLEVQIADNVVVKILRNHVSEVVKPQVESKK